MILTSDNVRGLRPSWTSLADRVCAPLEGHPQDSILDRYVRTFFTDDLGKFVVDVVVLSTKDHRRVLYLFCITCLLCRWGDLLGHGGEGNVLGRVPEHQQLWPGEH